jgi:hypothetical protein
LGRTVLCVVVWPTLLATKTANTGLNCLCRHLDETDPL